MWQYGNWLKAKTTYRLDSSAGLKYGRSLILEIEIPEWLYEMLLNEAAETGSAIEEITGLCFRKLIERNDDIAD